MIHLNPLYWLRKLYDWVLTWAEHKHSVTALAILSFAESSFFPIPPDVLLLAMGASKPKKSIYYAIIVWIFSVLGGLFGYYIGWGFWGITQDFFFNYVFSQEIFNTVALQYEKHAFWAVFTAGLTPIPYKVFTICAGVASINLPIFIIGSILGRGSRFLLVGGLMYYYGAPIRVWIEKNFNWLATVFTVLLILGFYLLKYLF